MRRSTGILTCVTALLLLGIVCLQDYELSASNRAMTQLAIKGDELAARSKRLEAWNRELQKHQCHQIYTSD